MTEYQAERLKFLSWLHAAAKDLVAHKHRLSADTYEVRVSDINALLTALGMLHDQDARRNQPPKEATMSDSRLEDKVPLDKIWRAPSSTPAAPCGHSGGIP